MAGVAVLGVASVSVSIVLYLLLAGPIGTLWAALAAIFAGVALAARRMVIFRSASRAGFLR